MSTDGYRSGIRVAYEGELIGERVYRRHALACSDPVQREKLSAIADVKLLTRQRLRPIAQRLGVEAPDTGLDPIIERRVDGLASLTWREFVDKAMREWPSHLARFESLRSRAPPVDQQVMAKVVEHELALLEFARRESSYYKSADCLAPLRACLSQRQIKIFQANAERAAETLRGGLAGRRRNPG